MSTSYLGIKLGSTTTYIYKPGNGIVLREASLVAMSSSFKLKDVKAIEKLVMGQKFIHLSLMVLSSMKSMPQICLRVF